MKRSRRVRWHKVAIATLTLPLLQTSCLEIAQRSLVNGFFDAAVPLLDQQLQNRLAEVFVSPAP